MEEQVKTPLEEKAPEPEAKSAEEQKQTTEQWLADPANRQKVLLLAKQIQNVCGKTWFTLTAACRRSGETRQSVFSKLSICGQFGFMAHQTKEGKETLYKVVLTVDDQLQVLRFFATQHENQLRGLYHEIKKLQALKPPAAEVQQPVAEPSVKS